MKVLLAEDEKNFGLVLKNELSLQSYDVDHVVDGVDAVLSVIKGAYDMVLMDIKLPRLQGTDAIRIIKAVFPSIPVIAFSGHADDKEVEEVTAAGALLCLRKPFEFLRLREEMARLFGVNGEKING